MTIRRVAATLVGLFALSASAAAETPGQLVADSKTGCKFWWPQDTPSQIVSFRWNGACSKGLAAGHGAFEAIERSRVRGGHLDGSETVTVYDTKWTGEGEAMGGKLNARAFMTTNSGYRVEGEYRDGVLNGRGYFTTNDAFVKGRYEGEFKNGKPEGTGVLDEQEFLFKDGPPLIVHYVGEWKDGKQIKGLLIQTMPGCFAEERYDGEMTDGKFNGRGTLRAADGKVYSGVWNMDRINVGGREISRSDITPIGNVCRK